MTDITFDPAIYGGQSPTGNSYTPMPIPEVRGTVAPVTVQSEPETVAYAESISKGSMSSLIGEAALAAARRPTATAGESAKAAMGTWSTHHVAEWLSAPKFAPDADYDTNAFMKTLPFTPTEGEDKVLRTASSWDEAAYKLNILKEQRDLYSAMGDNPGVSLLVGALDPGFIALDIVSLGAGRIASAVAGGARTGRMVAGIGAGAGAYALGRIEQDQTGISDAQVIGMALLNGAASAVAYRGGKMVPKDPDFPADELLNTVNRLNRTAEEVAAKTVREEAEAIPRSTRALHVSEDELVSNLPRGKRTGNDLLDIAAADPKFADLTRAIREVSGEMAGDISVRTGGKSHLIDGDRAFYSLGDHTIVVGKNVDAQTALHEVMHGLTSHKLEYGLANPATTHGALVKKLDDIRVEAIAEAKRKGIADDYLTKYFTDDLHEFVAGLYSRDNKFIDMLANMRQGNVTMLGRVVDAVRKILGIAPSMNNQLARAMGVTEDLIKTGLDVELKEAKRTIMMAPKGTPSQQAEQIINHESRAAKVGSAIEWSLSKSLGKFGDEAKRVARLLVDDPVNMTGDSVVSQHRAIRADFSAVQYRYNDELLTALKEQGYGTLKRITDSRGGLEAQSKIEKQVAMELLRRDSYIGRGLPVPKDANLNPTIAKLADIHGEATQLALREMKASGVKGAEAVGENAGYFTRRWNIEKIEGIEKRLIADGATEKAARAAVRDALASGMARRNGWDEALAKDIASAVIDRTRRKGYMEDNAMRGHVGNEAAKEVRDILTGAGMSGERLQRAMDVLTGVVDEAGKAPTLKHRIDIDMDVPIKFKDGNAFLSDLIDTDLTRQLDKYLDGSAANAAFARKGMATASDVDKLRTGALKTIARESDRREFVELFDNTVAALRGNPVGDRIPDAMRKLQAVTQMVGLSSSGLWQVTEYATAMSRFGIAKTTAMAIKELPGFRSMLNSVSKDKGQAEHLANILSRNSSQDIRMNPYIRRMEDNFEVPVSDTVLMSLQNAKQLVPYINGMRYIHHHQARMVGNLVADAFHKAALGDKRAIATMEQYGLKSHTIQNIKADILQHGLDTAKWSDKTWAEVRGPLNKMMDESVLRNRTGEIPAFAQFSSVGKFVFTFRSFVLGAHNKILAGTLGREGAAGLGLLLMYQYPLTFAATLANETMSGRTGQKSTKEVAGAAMSQMGAMGLFGDLAGIAFGNKQQFGAPGLIPVDRVYKAGAALSSGQTGAAASGLLDTVPILSIIPFHKALTDIPKGE